MYEFWCDDCTNLVGPIATTEWSTQIAIGPNPTGVVPVGLECSTTELGGVV
jgi:hypothetical protein